MNLTADILAWRDLFCSLHKRPPNFLETEAYLLGRHDQMRSCAKMLIKWQEEEQRATRPVSAESVPNLWTVYVLMAGDDPIGVFNSRETAINAHAQCYSMRLKSRYLRWYLWAFEINKAVMWSALVAIPERAAPFAWGETLITDENREQILSEWDRT